MRTGKQHDRRTLENIFAQTELPKNLLYFLIACAAKIKLTSQETDDVGEWMAVLSRSFQPIDDYLVALGALKTLVHHKSEAHDRCINALDDEIKQNQHELDQLTSRFYRELESCRQTLLRSPSTLDSLAYEEIEKTCNTYRDKLIALKNQKAALEQEKEVLKESAGLVDEMRCNLSR